MAGTYITWSIEGEKQLSRRLRNIEGNIRDARPAFQNIANELVDTFSGDVFDTRGSAIGEKWQPLSKYTIAQKARAGYGDKGPLERTGAMRNAFRSQVATDYAAVWNTASYFKYHQSNKSRSKIPRRVMMKLGHMQREMIVKEFIAHFRKQA